jgi:hypothetical protein
MFMDSPLLVFEFRADGTWHATVSSSPPMPGIMGTWSSVGARVTISDPSCDGPGMYDLTFGPGCGTATFALGFDGCSSRARALNGARLIRR